MIGLRNWRKRVKNTIEDLTLAQPFLFRHLSSLVQVAADRKGPFSSSGHDGDTHRGAGRDRL